MKKFSLMSVAVLSAIVLIVSQACSKQELSSDIINTDEQELAFEQFMTDLDSLNYSLGYNIYETKGWQRDLTRSVADAVGGALGTKFGSTLGASAGSSVGPAGAVVGYLAGRKYGGTVGTIVASTIAGAVYDMVSRNSIPEHQLTDNNSPRCLLDDSRSLGEVHNAVLSQVLSNGKNYVSEDGTVNINELYTDVLQISEEMNIEDDLCRNEEYIEYMEDFFRAIADITFQDAAGSSSGSYESKVKTFLREDKGFSASEANNVMDIISATQVSALLDEPQAIEYEEEFIELVENSSLSADNKILVKATGSISIMSTNFWYAEK